MSKVRVETEGPVTILMLNRPEVHNCVDGEAAVAIATSIESFASDPDARVLIVTGSGEKAFCSGADLKNPSSLTSHDWVRKAGPMGFARLDPGKPTIAAINGYCFAGGMELAAWCDFRIAATNAEFGGLNRRWGVPFVDGGTQRFARIMGQGNALFLLESGIRFGAERAYELGFVQEVVPSGESLNRALEIAKRIAEYPQSSLRADRAALLQGLGQPLLDGIELEARLGFAALDDMEMQNGLDRFVSGDRPEAPR